MTLTDLILFLLLLIIAVLIAWLLVSRQGQPLHRSSIKLLPPPPPAAPAPAPSSSTKPPSTLLPSTPTKK